MYEHLHWKGNDLFGTLVIHYVEIKYFLVDYFVPELRKLDSAVFIS